MIHKMTEMSQAVLSETVEMLSKASRKTPHETNMLKLGIIGEQIVYDALKTTGAKVEKTSDWFDDEKDGVFNGETYEVKTVYPWNAHYGLPIKANQIRKLQECDVVFMVQVPSCDESEVKIWELPKDRRNSYAPMTTRDGRTLCLYEFTTLVPWGIMKNDKIAKDMASLHPTAKQYKRNT